MASDFGLPGLMILGEQETWACVYIDAEPNVVNCPHCRGSHGLSDPKPNRRLVVADTPSRGRRTKIRLATFSYRCRPCGKDFEAAGDGIDARRGMTHRLIRYIENTSFRRPRSAIAQEVGVSEDSVRRIVIALADRLARHHRFPTPRVLGIDDLKMNRRIYTVFTDAETGRAIGLIDKAKAEPMGEWMATNLDLASIRVIVSDLGAANLTVCGRDDLRHVLHVGDRWHILQGCQKAMSKVIAQKLSELGLASAGEKRRGVKKKANLPRRKARTLRNLRQELLGRRKSQRDPANRTLFDGQLLQPLLDDSDFERVHRAFWARIDLAKVHLCSDFTAARDQLERFYRAASHPSIAAEFGKIVKRVRTNESLIAAHYEARDRYPDIAVGALSTSSTERRNGTIRAAWKAGRGIRHPAYLRMRALYEPYSLDVDIVECGETGCARIEGPTDRIAGLTAQEPGTASLPRAALRCAAHAEPSFADVRAA